MSFGEDKPQIHAHSHIYILHCVLFFLYYKKKTTTPPYLPHLKLFCQLNFNNTVDKRIKKQLLIIRIKCGNPNICNTYN